MSYWRDQGGEVENGALGSWPAEGALASSHFGEDRRFHVRTRFRAKPDGHNHAHRLASFVRHVL